jgi:biopolymer transport protein ExbD
MSVRTKARRMHLNAEINVVSLIDVILLLLLIFMITAPMMTSGIELTLPTGQVLPMESKDAILVELREDGKIFVDGKEWARPRLEDGFKTYAKGRSEVTLRADFRLEYGVIYDVFRILSEAGSGNLNLAGEERRGG